MTDEKSEQMTDKKDPKMSEDEDLEKFGIADERHWIQINYYVTYIT